MDVKAMRDPVIEEINGFYAEGHHDPEQFAEKVRAHFGVPAEASRVKHVHLSIEWPADGDIGRFYRDEKGDPYTVVTRDDVSFDRHVA